MALVIPRMRIPVFVSCPSKLSPAQDKSAEIIQRLITKNKMEWRALGRSDYPGSLPLREVVRMIKHCSGGIVLGFEQYKFPPGGISQRGHKDENKIDTEFVAPTSWNNLEAGILYARQLPMLIFKEKGITGGVFDVGASDIFIHTMPTDGMPDEALEDLDSVFQRWASEVRRHYYDS